jgi:membrane fusion protein, multidrug efflux system
MIKFFNPGMSLTVLSVAWLVILSGCKQPQQTQAAPPNIDVAAVEQRDVPVYAESVGNVQADVYATISAKISGYLLTRNYVEGSEVTNGQVLFQIDSRPYKAILDQALANVIKTEQNVRRYRPLAKTGAISQEELDDAVQANAAAMASAEQARLNYEFCTIRSPVDGVAGLAQAQVGNLISPSSGQLTTVTKVHPIRVYFSIAQELLTKMMEERQAERIGPLNATNGPQLELTLASGSVYPIRGRVRFSDNQIDVMTGTIRVVGEFDNPNRLLVPGMFVRVRARIGVDKDALLVPQIAVTDFQGRDLVAVVSSDKKVTIQPVVTGQQVGPLCVVTGKLKAGEQIVAEGVQKVREGMVVNPTPYNPSAVPTEMSNN